MRWIEGTGGRSLRERKKFKKKKEIERGERKGEDESKSQRGVCVGGER